MIQTQKEALSESLIKLQQEYDHHDILRKQLEDERALLFNLNVQVEEQQHKLQTYDEESQEQQLKLQVYFLTRFFLYFDILLIIAI